MQQTLKRFFVGPEWLCIGAALGVLTLFTFCLPLSIIPADSASSLAHCRELLKGRARADGVRLTPVETSTRLDPADTEVMAELGLMYELRAADRAESIYRRVLAIDPGYADVRL